MEEFDDQFNEDISHISREVFIAIDEEDNVPDKFYQDIKIKDVTRNFIFLLIILFIGYLTVFIKHFLIIETDRYTRDLIIKTSETLILGERFIYEQGYIFFWCLFGLLISVFTNYMRSFAAWSAILGAFSYGYAIAYFTGVISAKIQIQIWIIFSLCFITLILGVKFAEFHFFKSKKITFNKLTISTIVAISILGSVIRFIIYPFINISGVMLLMIESASIILSTLYFFVGAFLTYEELYCVEKKLNKKYPKYIKWYIAQKWAFGILFSIIYVFKISSTVTPKRG